MLILSNWQVYSWCFQHGPIELSPIGFSQGHAPRPLLLKTAVFSMAEERKPKRPKVLEEKEIFVVFCPCAMVNRILNRMPQVCLRVRQRLMEWKKVVAKVGFLNEIGICSQDVFRASQFQQQNPRFFYSCIY